MTATDELAQALSDIDVVEEMEESFLSYALSTITSRAIPDVRDGLKPVQRRLLYSMYRGGMRADSPFLKCANAVGATMGDYHPHGDQAIYEALVRMGQWWSMRLPLIDAQGNFGAPGLPPAAMRYTEARLAAAAMPMLEEIDEDTVDWVENYDQRLFEPVVLPARLPNLLVNGSSGIAVGMATSLPPHNLGEVVAALRHLLEDRDADFDQLHQHMPAPDFPTGGVVIAGDAAAEAYRSGSGSLRVRAATSVEDVSARRRGVVITELPYAVSPERVIEAIKDLVKEQRLAGVSDVKDLSDRKTGLRLVVECKAGIDPEALREQLFRLTPLEETFTYKAVVLDEHGQPRQLGLVELLGKYLDHRFDVLVRRTRHRLGKARDRAHVLEGLKTALDAIDTVVAIIRGSADSDTARGELVAQLDLTEVQAQHVLDMQLRRLTQLDVRRVEEELAELAERIEALEALLASDQLQRETIDGELAEAADRFGDARRTKVIDHAPATVGDAPLQVPDRACVVALTATGKLSVLPVDDQGGVDTGRRRAPRADDVVVSSVAASTHATVLLVTSAGRLLHQPVVELPDASVGSDPVETSAFVDLDAGERVVAVVGCDDEKAPAAPLALLTRGGAAKRLDPRKAPTRSGATVIDLADGDAVVAAGAAADDAALVMVTSQARALRVAASAVPAQGRASRGVAGVRLGDGDAVVGGGAVPGDDPGGEHGWLLATVTDGQRGKVTPASDYPTKGRSTRGVTCHGLGRRDQRLDAATVTPPGTAPAVVVRGGKGKLLDRGGARRDGAGRSIPAAPQALGYSYVGA